MKTPSLFRFIFCALFFFGFSAGHVFAASADNNRRLKITVLENTTTSDCAYSLGVTVEVKYKAKDFSAALGQLILESSQDGVNYSPVVSKEVAQGRGSSLLTFDAGDCTQDIRASIQ